MRPRNYTEQADWLQKQGVWTMRTKGFAYHVQASAPGETLSSWGHRCPLWVVGGSWRHSPRARRMAFWLTIAIPIYRSLHTTPEAPYSQKVSKRSCRAGGPPRPECQKGVEKVLKHWFLTPFWLFLGSFGTFFDTLKREAREDFFETFWGFRGSAVWRLL